MKTPIVCDTHALIYWSLAPQNLGPAAARFIERALAQREVLCADISLWEIAMLAEKGRLRLDAKIEEYLDQLVAALQLTVLPISPRIAALAQSGRFTQKDPADRLIAATALALEAPLVSRDAEFTRIEGLRLVWR